MIKQKGWILFALIAGASISLLLIIWLDIYLLDSSWYSLIFWLPFSLFCFWLSSLLWS